MEWTGRVFEHDAPISRPMSSCSNYATSGRGECNSGTSRGRHSRRSEQREVWLAVPWKWEQRRLFASFHTRNRNADDKNGKHKKRQTSCAFVSFFYCFCSLFFCLSKHVLFFCFSFFDTSQGFVGGGGGTVSQTGFQFGRGATPSQFRSYFGVSVRSQYSSALVSSVSSSLLLDGFGGCLAQTTDTARRDCTPSQFHTHMHMHIRVHLHTRIQVQVQWHLHFHICFIRFLFVFFVFFRSVYTSTFHLRFRAHFLLHFYGNVMCLTPSYLHVCNTCFAVFNIRPHHVYMFALFLHVACFYYYSARNKFERFRGFLELISRFEFEFCHCVNYFLKDSNFWCVHVNVPWPVCTHATPFRMLWLP